MWRIKEGEEANEGEEKGGEEIRRRRRGTRNESKMRE